MIVTLEHNMRLTANKTKLFLTVKSLILWPVLVMQLMPQGDKDIKDEFTAENCHKGHQRSNLEWPYSQNIPKDLP